MVHRTERQVALDRTIVAAIVLASFAFYVSIQAGVLVSRDAHTMASVGRNLVQHGSLHRSAGSPKAWSPYGIGVSLVTVPLWALQLHVAPHSQGWVSSGNAVITAVTGGFLYRCGVEIGWRRTVAVITVLVFGLLTMAPVYSTEMFSEPGGDARDRRHAPRPAPLVPGQQARSVAGGRRSVGRRALPHRLVRDGGPPDPGAGALVHPATRAALDRTPLAAPGRRAPDRRLGLDARLQCDPLPDGPRHLLRRSQLHRPAGRRLYRQVLSPGKGFFWYDPILIVGLVGVVLLYRRRQRPGDHDRGPVRGSGARVREVAVPRRERGWGPRFLVPLCALLSLGVGEAIARSGKLSRGRRLWAGVGVIVVLGAAGAFVNVLSLWVPYEQQHRDFTAPATLPTDHTLALVEIQRRQALTFNRWSHTPLRYAVTHLAHASRTGVGFPLRWWQGGWSVPGITALVVAIAALSFRAPGRRPGFGWARDALMSRHAEVDPQVAQAWRMSRTCRPSLHGSVGVDPFQLCRHRSRRGAQGVMTRGDGGADPHGPHAVLGRVGATRARADPAQKGVGMSLPGRGGERARDIA